MAGLRLIAEAVAIADASRDSWFSEGLETRDLVEAGTLLAELQ